MTVAEREQRARETSLTPDELGVAGRDPSARVRRTVAARPDLLDDVAAALASDPDRQVRELLAGNPACGADVLAALMDDPHWRVRWTAAQSPSPDPAVQEAGARSTRADVREALAARVDLAAEISTALAADPVTAVRAAIAGSTRDVELLARLASDPSWEVRGEVALSAAVTDDLLRILAADAHRRVRATVATQERTPRDVVLRLARDRSADVRWCVLLARPGDAELSDLLRDDPDAAVASQARG